MKNSILIILTALLAGQSVFAQELSKTRSTLDTIPVKSEVPRIAMPSSPRNVSRSHLPYSQPIPSIPNNNQPTFINDSILSRGSKDPLQTVAPLKSNGNYNAASMMSLGGWNIIGASEINSFPGMMETGSAAVGLNRSFGNLTINVGVGANIKMECLTWILEPDDIMTLLVENGLQSLLLLQNSS